jgi:hypothetical protein
LQTYTAGRHTWEGMPCDEGFRNIQGWQAPQGPHLVLHTFNHKLLSSMERVIERKKEGTERERELGGRERGGEGAVAFLDAKPRGCHLPRPLGD